MRVRLCCSFESQWKQIFTKMRFGHSTIESSISIQASTVPGRQTTRSVNSVQRGETCEDVYSEILLVRDVTRHFLASHKFFVCIEERKPIPWLSSCYVHWSNNSARRITFLEQLVLISSRTPCWQQPRIRTR